MNLESIFWRLKDGKTGWTRRNSKEYIFDANARLYKRNNENIRVTAH